MSMRGGAAALGARLEPARGVVVGVPYVAARVPLRQHLKRRHLI